MQTAIKKFCLKNDAAMTLPELLVSAFILVLAVTAILLSFLRAMELQEASQAFSAGSKAALSQLDKIRSTDYSLIKSTFNGIPFDVPGVVGKGACFVSDVDSDLLLIAVSVSWQQRNGRTYGGDTNRNGQLDAGEQAHPVYTSLPNSPLIFVTRIFQPLG